MEPRHHDCLRLGVDGVDLHTCAVEELVLRGYVSHDLGDCTHLEHELMRGHLPRAVDVVQIICVMEAWCVWQIREHLVCGVVLVGVVAVECHRVQSISANLTSAYASL